MNTLKSCKMKYFHGFVLFLSLSSAVICSIAQGQSVAVLGEVGSDFDLVQRLSVGGYVASQLISGTEIISRFDQDMQCIGSKELQIPGTASSYPVITAATANGDMTVLVNSGVEFIPGTDPFGTEDTADVWVDLVRLNLSATPTWSKRLHFRTGMDDFADYVPLKLQVNDIGEAVMVLRSSSATSANVMVRMSANGEPLWLTTFLDYPYVVDGFIPDGSTDCYFSCSNSSNSGPLTMGLIDASGVAQWTKRISYLADLDLNNFHLCMGADGKLLAAGMVSNNTFLLKVDADGMPEWFRLISNLPPTGQGISSGLSGIQPTSYGYMLVRNAGYPARAVVQYHALDGSLLGGVGTTLLSEGDFTERIVFNTTGSVGDEFTLAGIHVVHNTIFNQFVQRPCIVTLPVQQGGDCFFGSESFAELQVATSDLMVEDVTITSFLPVPPVTDIAVNVVDVPLVVITELCAVVGVEENASIGPSVTYDPVSALATVSGVTSGQLVSLRNALGQDLGSWRVRSNTIEVPMADLNSGAVLLCVQNAQGEVLVVQKLMVVN